MNLVDLKGDTALSKPLPFATTHFCLVVRSMYCLVLPVKHFMEYDTPLAIYFICHIQFEH
jgi:hypothetical protein